MINLQILVGRLGANPEYRVTEDEIKICKFSIATTDFYKGDPQTEWHNIVCFDKTAENCHKYLKKGSLVFVQGRKSTTKTENSVRVETYAKTIKFLDSSKYKAVEQ